MAPAGGVAGGSGAEKVPGASQAEAGQEAVTPSPIARCLSFSSPGTSTSVQKVSQSAAKKRVGRLMKPTCDGKLKVPQELVSEWETGDQDRLVNEFIASGMVKELINL